MWVRLTWWVLLAGATASCNKDDPAKSTKAPKATPQPSSSAASSKAAGPDPASAAPFRDEPWAGLHLHHRGAALDSARRVVVLMHGYGAPGDDLVDLAPVLNVGEKTAFLFPEAPRELPMGGRAWFERDRSDFERGYGRMSAFLDFLREQHPELPIVLGGFSQGAILTSNLLTEESENVRAALIFSPANFLPHPPKEDSPRVPLFVSHGRVDRVLPFEGGQRLAKKFDSWGYPVTWLSFHGRHSIPSDVVDAARGFLEKRLVDGQR